MTFNSKIEIKASQRLLKTYYDALIPESESTKRSSYNLDLKKDKLIISIIAEDATALRAITNTLTNLIAIIEKTWRIKND